MRCKHNDMTMSPLFYKLSSMILLDCHAHTRIYSSCSRLAPDELCSLALQRGLTGQVITEHRHQWPENDLDELRAAFPALRIYGGVEYTLQEGYDVVCITGPIRLDLPPYPHLEGLYRGIAPYSGQIFTFVAHPYRYRDNTPAELEEILTVVDAIEMNSVNILRNNEILFKGKYIPLNQSCYDAAQSRFHLKALYNTDSHRPTSVAAIANSLDLPELPESTGELIRVLRSEPIREWQDPDLIREHLDSYLVK